MKLKFGLNSLSFLIIYLNFSVFLISVIPDLPGKVAVVLWMACVLTGDLIFSILEGNASG